MNEETPTYPTLAAALAAFQAELPDVTKLRRADVQTRTGPGYSYSFADLSDVSRAVLPMLGRFGLSFTARPTLVENRLVLVYELLHVSGQSKEGVYPLPASNNQQEIGGAITYARRYCLCSVTGVAPENDDDDAAAASRPQAQRRGRTAQRRTQAPGESDGQPTRTAQRAHQPGPPLPGEPGFDGPPDGPAVDPNASGTVTGQQMKKLQTVFSRHGVDDPDERRSVAAHIARRGNLASAKDLSLREASAVIDELERVANSGQPFAEYLTEMLRSAKNGAAVQSGAGA